MADRAVSSTGKDEDGHITSLGNNSGACWSPRPKAEAIRDIEAGLHTYHVPWRTGRTRIRVVDDPAGKYLRTDRDNTARNDLDDLPSC